jgi:hypothetical protein
MQIFRGDEGECAEDACREIGSGEAVGSGDKAMTASATQRMRGL